MTATINRCKYCGKELDSEQDICKICNAIRNLKETKDCPFCKKRVELTRVEDHIGYELKFYSCGHNFKHVTRSIVEAAIKVSDTVSWKKQIDPVSAIERIKDSKNYYDLFSRSCSAVQYNGKKILLQDSRNSGNPISKSRFKNMDLSGIASELYNRNLIDKSTFDKIDEIRQMRNEFQHDGLAFKISSGQAEEAEIKITNALDSANILKAMAN
jgi:hypothetical protein